MRNILALVVKEFLQLRRDPRLIGFIILGPVVFMILFGLALKLEPENVKMAYVDQDKSFFSNLIKTSIWTEGYFQMYEVKDKAAIISDIRKGKAQAGLFIDKTFTAELVENNQPFVTMYVDGTMPSLATAMDNKSGAITSKRVTNSMYFQEAGAERVIVAPQPFILDLNILFNPDKKETWFFLPGVIGVLIMQIALILTSTAIVRERESHTLEQIVVSPISKTQFILGKTLPYVFISFIDFYLILGLSWWLFDLPTTSSHLMLLALVLVYVVGFIAIGLAISTVSQTQQQAIFLSIFILIPSILLSGFIFPIEAMPSYIQPIAYVIPFTYFVKIIRGILLKGNDILTLAPYYAALLGFAIGFTMLSISRFRKVLD